MEHLTIREILDQVYRGQIRIPAFQRGFVWEPDMVAFLMDSIYKKYPFGSLLFWRTHEQLTVERKLGPFTLPDPCTDYPIDYVLDGQQRITSIFGVFQTEMDISNLDNWQDVYFDYTSQPNAQETQFFALKPEDVDAIKHFPLRALFETTTYRRATKDFNDTLARKIDELQAVFKEVRIPIQSFRTEDKATVAIIFERVNRQGVPLDTLQLLSAWTWSEDFQLHEQFDDLSEELAPFGFSDLGLDTNLELRCCSAVLANESTPESLMQLNGANVRNRFDEIVNGVKGAIDYLRTNLKVYSISNLPFQTLIIPLTVFFAAAGEAEVRYTDEQRITINEWFWKSCFSKRYSSGVIRNLNTDIAEIKKLKNGEESKLGKFSVNITADYFIENSFGITRVNTKTFILLLAQNNPRSFVSGAPIDVADKLKIYNRNEFHHLMPKAFLRDSDQNAVHCDCIANFCFLSRADNRHLGGDRPSIYRQKMGGNHLEILESTLCPNSLFDDNFEAFITARSQRLSSIANRLCGNAA